MMQRTLLVAAGLLLGLYVLLSPSMPAAKAGAAREKYLIEFGWDEPDPAMMRQQTAEMERSPFDGCVFHVNYAKPGGGAGNFTWEGWGRRAFTDAELQPALKDLQAAPFQRFRQNFLRFNVTPGDVDWFDDHAAILANAQLAARIAKEARCPGLLFDIEQYTHPLFDYRRQRDAGSKPWETYASQAHRRGREVMEAFQQGYPDLTVFLTFAYSLPWQQTHEGTVPLRDTSYGLLAPFLDGMVEAARGKARLVEGNEGAYGYRTPEQFASGDRMMREGARPVIGDPAAYRRVASFSFGLWLDYDWRRRSWNADDPSQNYFTPETFAASVRQALQRADDYVWIYTETPRWWTAEGKPAKLPAAYDQALRRAREAAANQ